MLTLPMAEVEDNLRKLRKTLGFPENWYPDERSPIGKRCRVELGLPFKDPRNDPRNTEKHGEIQSPEKYTSNEINDLEEKVHQPQEKSTPESTPSPQSLKLKRWLLKHPGSTVREIYQGMRKTFAGYGRIHACLAEIGAEEEDGRWRV